MKDFHVKRSRSEKWCHICQNITLIKPNFDPVPHSYCDESGLDWPNYPTGPLTWWWKTTDSSRATPQNSHGMRVSPSRGLTGELCEAGEADRGKVGLLDRRESGMLRMGPDELWVVSSVLGEEDGCLLKDAKAEAGLHPVWKNKKSRIKICLKYMFNSSCFLWMQMKPTLSNCWDRTEESEATIKTGWRGVQKQEWNRTHPDRMSEVSPVLSEWILNWNSTQSKQTKS